MDVSSEDEKPEEAEEKPEITEEKPEEAEEKPEEAEAYDIKHLDIDMDFYDQIKLPSSR